MTDPDRHEAEALLKQKILNEYPRLKENDTFEFACNPGVSCFTDCCADINIVLTPYDVLRMKDRLGIPSGEFLDKYTVTLASKDFQLPVVVLKLSDNEKKSCQFLTKDGCGIYDSRPWPCRMYPLGLASPSEDNPEITDPFYFLMREDVCKGFVENGGKRWTVREWMDNQGVADYNRMGELWKEITLHRFFAQGGELDPAKMDMLFLATYDLDRFRQFVFETSFLNRFDVEPDLVEAMRTDDEALLTFGFRWVRFYAMREKTIAIKPAVAEEFLKQDQRERDARKRANRQDKD